MASPRVLPVDVAESPAELQPVFAGIEQAFGVIPNLLRTVARRPEFVMPLAMLLGAIRGSDVVDARTKELAILTVSTLNECHY
jgi:hypothetical protein